MNKRFRAYVAKYRNLHIIETTPIDSNQILHSDKDHQMPFAGGPNMRIRHPRWRTAAILENRTKSSAVAEMGDRLATIDMGRKWGGAAVGAGSPAWAEAYLHTKWHPDPCSHLATTDMGRKLGGGLCALG